MFEDQYKYTQVPSPLVQPGGVRQLFNLGGTTVIGEESDIDLSSKPRTHNVSHPQKQVVRTEAAAPKKSSPVKILAIFIAIIVIFNIAIGLFSCAAEVAEDFFYEVEQALDQDFFEFFDD